MPQLHKLTANTHLRLTDEKRGNELTNRCLTTDIREKGFYLKAWRGECEFDIEHKDKYSVDVTSKSLSSVSDGALEIDIIVPKKPESNVFTYDIVTKNLEFFYQPALTQEEIDAGDIRPDNVVGSYAVYHSTKSGNYIDKNGVQCNYGTGKAFHIYRPEAIDSDGKRIWCDLDVDTKSGKLSITVPQEFIDTAIYPIVIDPIFGTTTIGASGNADLGGTLFYAHKVTSPSTDITNAYVKSITAYQTAESVGGNLVWGIYVDRAGIPDTKVIWQSTGQAYPATTVAWTATTQPFTAGVGTFPQAISGSTGYWLAAQGGSNQSTIIRSRYDTVGGNERARNDSVTYTTYPTMPADYGVPSFLFTRRTSVYVTYYVVETSTITSDAVIESGGATTDTVTINSNAHIKTSDTTTITSSGHIIVSDTTSILSNSHISVSDSGTVYSDAHILKNESGTVTSDAHIKVTDSGTIYSDAHISVTESGTITSDATIESSVTTDTVTISSNAHITVNDSTSITSDAEIQSNVYTDTVTINSSAHITVSESASITSDGHIKTSDSTTILSSASVAINESVTITSDGHIRGLVTITSNAQVSALYDWIKVTYGSHGTTLRADMGTHNTTVETALGSHNTSTIAQSINHG